MTNRLALSLLALVGSVGAAAATDRVPPKDAVPHITTIDAASAEAPNLADLRIGREDKAQ